MQGKDKDYPSEIYAVIGRAVSALLEAGEPLEKKNVLIMLQAHSTATRDKHLQSIYQQAFRYLLESFH
ncbi:hypothetical protein [Erwinia billingiae]|uniref:Uncharacterized protein n=1 Tax=Erwinia billingiae (strain Eb661) TaxID=634500 RepID=D8MSM2_ERWBE|nr:hypothetical protein [Erwinia billingiae]MBN7120571.1 hypothetical protein [Erwinia billingiae]MCX0500394.1 hypothetical protein [Erwinia billingiae]PRB59997.1 hypothetical protein CQ001_07430 [Erwinia billingiae]CAX59829.1 Uncharacterized protein EbC_22980 [Erwinia billingiae Eb661]